MWNYRSAVSKGAKIKNDPLIVLESEKAAMEVPADYDGVVIDVLVKEGSVAEGKIFATLEIKEEILKKRQKKRRKKGWRWTYRCN